MSTWIVLLAVGVGTYALRASMFVLLGRHSLPAWADRPMTFVAPAAITALTLSMMFTHDQAIDPAPLREMAAIAAGFLAVRRTGNVMHAFAAGLPIFWVTGLVLG